MMRRAAVVVAAALALTACAATDVPQVVRPTVTPAPAAALADFYSQPIEWKACGKTMQCASYLVPLDYADPTGRTLRIRIARVPAQGERVGNLVINPGGPGGSGIDFIADPMYAVGAGARRDFDLIGFDPRGVGRSNPLWCLRDSALDAWLDVDASPDTAAERTRMFAVADELAAACTAEDAELFAHMSTAEVARDMDILRELLGDAQLRYLGKSYGTELGVAYAKLFPERVGPFVLDGAVDPVRTPSQMAYDQARAFERAAGRFVAWCVSVGDCPLGASRDAGVRRLGRFLQDLDTTLLRTSDPERSVTQAVGYTAVLGALYVPEGGWDWLLTALEEALEQRDGSTLLEISDWFTGRDAKGRYHDNANTALYVVNCLDREYTGTERTFVDRARRWDKELPLFGAVLAWGDSACVNWPVAANTELDDLAIGAIPPVVVVGTVHDPATPMAWARALADFLPGSRLIEYVGDGHTAYAQGNLCVDRAVDAYLRADDAWAASLPKKGLRCA